MNKTRIPAQKGEDRAELKMITPTEETIIPLKFCVVGGVLADGSNAPMGAYLGNMNSIDASIALTHSLRAFIKFLIDANPSMTVEQAKALILLVLDEAVNKERENEHIENVSLNEHVWKMKYDKNKFNKGDQTT